MAELTPADRERLHQLEAEILDRMEEHRAIQYRVQMGEEPGPDLLRDFRRVTLQMYLNIGWLGQARREGVLA
jgi:hypothetical protein